MQDVLSCAEARAVADALFHLDWESEDLGWMNCPGQARHTKPDGPRDCKLMLAGGKPPTIHCLHASCAHEVATANFALRSALGKAETAKKHDGKSWVPPQDWRPEPPQHPAPPPPEFDSEKLRAFAGPLAGLIDAVWLANRSPVDPTICSTHEFLSALYHPDLGERVLIFTNEYSQGEFCWPCAKLPDRGKEGVWFLAQPVTGEYVPNPRSKPPGQPSRRVMECVRSWRYMLLESDEAPARQWLAAVAQLPLRIAAIYTSGSRSVHVLVQVDAKTREEWDRIKEELLQGVVTLGACRGSLSSVRLTRLPGCLRLGKTKALKDAAGQPVLDDKGRPRSVYEKFQTPGEQKLLYLAPGPDARSLTSLVSRRDVVAQILEQASVIAKAPTKAPLPDLETLVRRARHVAPVSSQCATLASEAASLLAVRMEGAK
jgi:hypothetical protein